MSEPVPASSSVRVLPAVGAAVLAGVFIAAQGRANGGLASAGAGVLLASLFSYLGTLATVLLVLLARRRGGAAVATLRQRGRWWWYAVGLGGIPSVLAFSYGVPIVGVAVASVGTVAGQTVAGLLLDTYGVGVATRMPLNPRRLLAALTAVAGLALSVLAGQAADGTGAARAVAIGALFFVAGVGLAVQNAGNGAVSRLSADPMVPTLTSVLGGTAGMLLVLAVAGAGGALAGTSLPGSGWLYLGGPLGAGIVVLSVWAVGHLGTFTLTLATVGGQLAAALVVDLVAGVAVSPATVASVAAISVATALGVGRSSR